MADADKIATRPRQYLDETGVPLLTGGVIFVLLGGSVLIQQALPSGFVAQESPKWIAICCVGAALWGEKRLKQRAVFREAVMSDLASARCTDSRSEPLW